MCEHACAQAEARGQMKTSGSLLSASFPTDIGARLAVRKVQLSPSFGLYSKCCGWRHVCGNNSVYTRLFGILMQVCMLVQQVLLPAELFSHSGDGSFAVRERRQGRSMHGKKQEPCLCIISNLSHFLFSHVQDIPRALFNSKRPHL